jgi:hypothetical protein
MNTFLELCTHARKETESTVYTDETISRKYHMLLIIESWLEIITDHGDYCPCDECCYPDPVHCNYEDLPF